MKNKGTKSVP